MDIVVRWDVMFGGTFKIGPARAREIIETGELKLRRNGELDMRYRTSRFIKRVLPEWRDRGT